MQKIVPWIVVGGAVLVVLVYILMPITQPQLPVATNRDAIVVESTEEKNISTSEVSAATNTPSGSKAYSKYFTCRFGPFEFSYPDVGQLSEGINKEYHLPTTTIGQNNWACEHILRESGNGILGTFEGTTTPPLYRGKFDDTAYGWDNENKRWLVYSDYPKRVIEQKYPAEKKVYGQEVVGYYAQMQSYEELWDVIIFERNGYYLIYSPHDAEDPFSAELRSSMKYSD